MFITHLKHPLHSIILKHIHYSILSKFTFGIFTNTHADFIHSSLMLIKKCRMSPTKWHTHTLTCIKVIHTSYSSFGIHKIIPLEFMYNTEPLDIQTSTLFFSNHLNGNTHILAFKYKTFIQVTKQVQVRLLHI